VHADESGRAGNQHRHRVRPVCSSARSLAYLQKLLKQPIAM
jgi:hypothetical protein